MTSANFRFSTDILQRLGEELVTSFDQGIVELVKNAYDADALKCSVELIDVEAPGGTVVVTDDGDGMTDEDIRNGWLVLGRSRKVPRERTKLNRLPAGSKGLGRLGALRMGREVLLRTRPRNDPDGDYSLSICWAAFDSTDVVEDVELPIARSDATDESGTRIEVRGLQRSVTEKDIQKLARELLLLTDPFGDPSGFKAELIAPMFEQYERRLRTAYFDDCEYRLVAAIDEEGRARAKVFDRSGGARWESVPEEFDTHYGAPVATFELWAFLLQGAAFAGRSTTVAEVREWLQAVGGVHLYHRGLRVRPYGDPGHDWLDMNLLRARDPELRPSTNTSIGRVTVVDEDESLLQKTDRTGFIENDAFRELRRFAIDAIEWMHGKRLQEREQRKQEEKRQTRGKVTRAASLVQREIAKLPDETRREVGQAVNQLEAARESERGILQDELRLYQTLASVGTAVSVFAHEIEGPATDLIASARAVERRARRALGDEYDSVVGKQVAGVVRAAERVARFATLPLSLLKRSKRRLTILDINATIEETIRLFEPYLSEARIDTRCQMSEDPARVHGSVAAVEAIVSNLVTNAAKAFKRDGADLADRRLLIRTSIAEGRVLLSVLDSGPGIPDRLADQIWLPGVSSDENGTGLGLTIVKDTVTELGGSVHSIPRSELGGAEFVIDLPLAPSP